MRLREIAGFLPVFAGNGSGAISKKMHLVSTTRQDVPHHLHEEDRCGTSANFRFLEKIAFRCAAVGFA